MKIQIPLTDEQKQQLRPILDEAYHRGSTQKRSSWIIAASQNPGGPEDIEWQRRMKERRERRFDD